ncbi:hypothetical protein [Thermus scotoductus]|nr:hypothetical protein [Thermus scotoductus]
MPVKGHGDHGARGLLLLLDAFFEEAGLLEEGLQVGEEMVVAIAL